MIRLLLPPERIGRALICAFGLAFLAGLFSGCTLSIDQRDSKPVDERAADCRKACAPFAVAAFKADVSNCYCADHLVGGGRP